MVETNKQKAALLIIDDDEQIRKLLIQILGGENDCTAVGSAEDALTVLDEANFDVVISDINMRGMSGLDLVPTILARDTDSVVVMISGQQSIESAIESMRAGAFDYITKPLDIRHVKAAVRRALSQRELLVQRRRDENHLEELVQERTAEIEHLCYYDRLTNLPNKILFVEQCAHAIEAAKANNQLVGIVLASIDRFKNINDTLGHSAADRLLIEVAGRFQNGARSGDIVARFDGAEFAFLLRKIGSANEIEDYSLSLIRSLKTSFHLAAQEVYVTASIGMSIFPDNGEDSSTLLKNAGAALQRAKKRGGNNHQRYRADMNALALNHLALETSLRQAIDNHEFVTYYQPVLDLASSRIVGLEALVRWQHPQLGVLPPSEFLSLAEDTGLILNISDLVMRSACAQTRQWQLEGFGDLRIAVNISARQFQQQDFLARTVEILEESRLNSSSLELEMTETSIMENPDVTAELLSQIRGLGVKVAVDDFGTGYSSLSYLKRLPIDTLKVDRAFVQGVTNDPHDEALVRAIVTLAHNLELRVVAEGVETKEQLDFLRLLGCDEGQGYLFGKPQPVEMVKQLLSRDYDEASTPSVIPKLRKRDDLVNRV